MLSELYAFKVVRNVIDPPSRAPTDVAVLEGLGGQNGIVTLTNRVAPAHCVIPVEGFEQAALREPVRVRPDGRD